MGTDPCAGYEAGRRWREWRTAASRRATVSMARSATGCRWGTRFVGTPWVRLQRLGVRPGLSGRLRLRLARPGRAWRSSWGLRRSAVTSDAGRHEQRHAWAGDARVVGQ